MSFTSANKEYEIEKANDPVWIKIAKREIGQKEILGEEDNPRIIEYHSATTLQATEDEVSWCSAFVSWCLEKSNIQSTKSAAARSYIQWGYPCQDAVYGCVVVFWRGSPDSWKGHVAFVVDWDDDYIYCLGGNQSDQVNVQAYSRDRVLGYRWPKSYNSEI